MSEARFKPGDRVFVELYPNTNPCLWSENIGEIRIPSTVMVRGVVRTYESWSHGYSERSIGMGPEVTKYILSYNDSMFGEDQLFATVAEFNERRGEAVRERAASQLRKAEEKRLQAYRDAKRLVADFESEMFSAQAAKP